MVQQGQFLERSVLVKSGELVLDGLFHRGARSPACVIAAPHPALGGSMIAPAVAELAWALTQAGHATLRFDYRGVGASQGHSRHQTVLAAPLPRIERAELEDELADLRAACDLLEQTTRSGPLCCIGYSFGAVVALAAAEDARVQSLVLIAPPTALADFAPLGRLRKPVLVVCAHHDALCDRAALQAFLAPLGDLARLEVIANADHGFLRGLPELGHTVAEYLRGGEPLPDLTRALEDEAGEDGAVELTLPTGGESEQPLELDD